MTSSKALLVEHFQALIISLISSPTNFQPQSVPAAWSHVKLSTVSTPSHINTVHAFYSARNKPILHITETFLYPYNSRIRCSSVSIVTGLLTGLPEFDAQQRGEIILLATASILTLRYTQPPRHSPVTSDEVKNAWIYFFTPPYVFMSWCQIKHKTDFLHLFTNSHELQYKYFERKGFTVVKISFSSVYCNFFCKESKETRLMVSSHPFLCVSLVTAFEPVDGFSWDSKLLISCRQ
jgi:hypothetical protein